MCQKKKGCMKWTYQHSNLSRCIERTTRKYIKNLRRKTDYSNEKQYRKHKHQQKKNNKKTKMKKKTVST